MTVLYVFLAVVSVIVIITAIELVHLLRIKSVPDLPDKADADRYSLNINGKSFEDLYLFLAGKQTEPSFIEDEVFGLLLKQSEYMNKRFDCADFRAQMLFKIYKDCPLSDRCSSLIKNTFLGFKYFIDEPGDDSMCYWSENHQILFAVSEYLAGQEWPEEIFTNDGKTGAEHMQMATVRIDAWMQQRFNYGFSEYLSNNYLAEDIAPMANFIAYSEDKKRAERMKIIMDILWLDVALNSVNNRFVAVSSRMYGNNKAANCIGNSIQSAMNILWEKEAAEQLFSCSDLGEEERKLIEASLSKKPNYIVLCFTDAVEKGLYTLPDAVKDIALSGETFISKMSCGLSPDDMTQENLVGQSDPCIMAQTGAETFTNPQVILNSLEYMRKNKLYSNKFLSYFKFLNLTVLRFINWQKVAGKHSIMPHGISLGRGNVYTYRTARYSLSTDIAKDVDVCGAQDHVWTANISEALTLFTTHPAGDGNSKYGASPGYWVGNGRRPMSIQHKNVNITVYKLPQKKRLGESAVCDITHAYMPRDLYDEFVLDGNMVIARKGGVFVAMISDGQLEYKPYNPDSAKGLLKGRVLPEGLTLEGGFDLCRKGGKYHSYITELSDSDTETFEHFCCRIKQNRIVFNNGSVSYKTNSGEIYVSFDGSFTVDGKTETTVFDRYDSVFCKAGRKDKKICINSRSHSLTLDFGQGLRVLR
jgi:hypothetical protein